MIKYKPKQFLIPSSNEESFKLVHAQNDTRARYSDRPDVALPQSRTQFTLSSTYHSFERQRYTVFALIGDLGGFLGAIVIIPTQLMSYYASGMLSRSLAN